MSSVLSTGPVPGSDTLVQASNPSAFLTSSDPMNILSGSMLAKIDLPTIPRGHFTTAVAVSSAFASGVLIDDVCRAATWATPCSFAKHYRLDVHARHPVPLAEPFFQLFFVDDTSSPPVRKRFPFMARKDCAAKLKEKQLLEIFPTINPNFLMDIFKDYNYSLEQTVQFLNSVLEADPVKTVVAKETARDATLSSYSASKTRDKKAKKSKEPEDVLSEKAFQDFEYPGYNDFRAEAFLHQQNRQECLKKAGEAYRMGMKPVAAFYVQRGRLHEQKMKEANQDAAMQIFEKVNALKLPENLLDLHGLHVDEALDHLYRVLEEKKQEYSLAGGKPYLYVITGRGNHSQGGVARIKPAVMKYLTSHKFRILETLSKSQVYMKHDYAKAILGRLANNMLLKEQLLHLMAKEQLQRA
ncbi:NEDD4-binding protein 2 [Varanus komodoensis]|nr:NEDD4-binding protein 2 [Varanus komodoensis]